MTWIVAVFITIAALLALLFNRLVRDRNQVAAAWSDVDVQLQRRHDLVPRLVEVVKAYAAHESELFSRLAAERSASLHAGGIGERGDIEQRVDRDARQLLALAEDYPDLKASENFAQLSSQLVEVEDHLQYARRFYNGSVRQYNTRCEQFPHLLIARAFAFHPAEFFAAEADSRGAVEVKLP
ncbi:MAG: LemA family protein [Rhodanobacteraceae bacterium]|nr:LemA family protein [Rhodanobacteraceae bacterium]